MAEKKVIEVEQRGDEETPGYYEKMISDFGDKKGKNKKPLITEGSGYQITLNE